MKGDGLSARIDRRRFLKRAGYGSVALASLAALGQRVIPVWANDGDQIEFTFAAQSHATIAGVSHQVTMAGDGKFNSSQVEGGGSFNHFKVVDGFPRPLLAAGTWKAKRLVSFHSIGTFGVFAAGLLELEVELIREFPSPLVVPASLEVVCNIGAVPLSTGKDEGFTLQAEGVSFEPSGVGITLFSTALDERS
jgi:hypothetical protein